MTTFASNLSYTNTTLLHSTVQSKISQTFIGNGEKVTSAVFRLKKAGAPTGNITVSIYEAIPYLDMYVPTGNVLATSDPVNIATTISSVSDANQTFTFSGANQINPSDGEYYGLSLNFSGGDSSNYLIMYYDGNADKYENLTVYNPTTGVWDQPYDYTAYFSITGTLTAPVVSTAVIQDANRYGGTITASITANGGQTITAQGLLWGTSPAPTLSGNRYNITPYEKDMAYAPGNLTYGTTYYARGYATNASGTTYGSDVTFTPTLPVETTYVYKTYRNDVFLGNLPNVISQFGYVQDINTAASQMTVKVGVTADVSHLAPSRILTELGEYLQTESGDYITTERAPDTVGDTSDEILIRNGNEVHVYEYNDFHPNGVCVFKGVIERWGGGFAGNTTEPTIDLLIYSKGKSLVDDVVQSGSSVLASQTTFPTYIDQGNYGGGFAQVITPTVDMEIDTVTLMLSVDRGGGQLYDRFILGLVEGTPDNDYLELASSTSTNAIYVLANPDAAIAYTRPLVINNTTPTEVELSFRSTQTLLAGHTYYLYAHKNNWSQIGRIWYADGTTSPGSVIYKAYSAQGVYPGPSRSYLTYDSSKPVWYIKLNKNSGNTTVTYSAVDPVAMLTDVIEAHGTYGGEIYTTDDSVELSGVNITYTFKAASVLEAINQALKYTPSGYYWYVDLVTNLLTFKPVSTTADIILRKGVHLSDLYLSASIENVKNVYFFSGGDTGGGVNLYKKYTDSTSVEDWGRRVGRESDNRVTLESTADIKGAAYLASNKDQVYYTNVTIPANVLDGSSVKPGMTIGFSGFGTFVDSIVIPAVRITRSAKETGLAIGGLPVRTTATLQQAIADIEALQTINNPIAPS